jgi:hypothetical protein
MSDLLQKYSRLDAIHKKLLQILAFEHGDSRYDNLHRRASSFGLKQSNGRELTQSMVRVASRSWVTSGLTSSSSNRPVPALMDCLIRDGLASDDATHLLALANPANSWVRRSEVLDFYLAFYGQDAEA